MGEYQKVEHAAHRHKGPRPAFGRTLVSFARPQGLVQKEIQESGLKTTGVLVV